MIYWNPSNNETHEWIPISGWNNSFSVKDKLQCTQLYFFFKDKKGYKETIAEIMAQMVIYKQKYKDLKYSTEQESMLEHALRPVYSP